MSTQSPSIVPAIRIAAISRVFAALSFFRKRRSDAIGVLVLHGVHTRAMSCQRKPPNGSIAADDLEVTLRVLASEFEIISLDAAVAMLEGDLPWRERCVVLTFDDSLKCLSLVATPLLAKLGMTATFFVSTSAISSGVPYWWHRLQYAMDYGEKRPVDVSISNGELIRIPMRHRDLSLARLKSQMKLISPDERDDLLGWIEESLNVALEDSISNDPHAEVMTWDDVRSMKASGMSIGSHSVRHPNLALLTGVALEKELVDSRAAIEEQIGSCCRHFCYPYGAHSKETVSAVRDVGYASAVTTLPPAWNRTGSPLHTLSRSHMPKRAHRLFRVLA